MGRETYIITRIEATEAELRRLRQFMSRDRTNKTTTLCGIWQGADISDEQIEDAKRSVFNGVESCGPNRQHGDTQE